MSKKRTTGTSASRTSSAARTGSPMDSILLQEIVQLMAANDLNTVDVRDGDKRVIIKRGAPMVQYAMTSAPVAAAPAPAPAAPAAASGGEKATDEANYVAIKSPMVGTYYSSPSPDAKPFVSVGSNVNDETDVCIIEAMKVFNNIKAECRGTIAKILVNNGQTVEFGQTLFLVKP